MANMMLKIRERESKVRDGLKFLGNQNGWQCLYREREDNWKIMFIEEEGPFNFGFLECEGLKSISMTLTDYWKYRSAVENELKMRAVDFLITWGMCQSKS